MLDRPFAETRLVYTVTTVGMNERPFTNERHEVANLRLSMWRTTTNMWAFRDVVGVRTGRGTSVYFCGTQLMRRGAKCGHCPSPDVVDCRHPLGHRALP